MQGDYKSLNTGGKLLNRLDHYYFFRFFAFYEIVKGMPDSTLTSVIDFIWKKEDPYYKLLYNK